jgi:acyl-CoA dehydrogenase
MHSHLVAVAAWRWRHQKAPTEALLRRVVTEQLVLVSSGGSDWLAGSGSAERVDGGYRITARKAFSSGCLAGDLLMTSAVLDDGETGPTVLHFAVPLKAAQVRIVESWDTLGMRGSGSHDVLIEGAFVPEAAISGRRPQGKWHPLFHCISMIAFPLIYAAYAGVADGARARALELAARRPADPGLLQRVGAMENAHRLMQLALADMVEQAVSGEPGPEATDRAMTGRTLVGEAAIDTVTRALEVAGGAGFYRAAGIERAFRDVQGARFHPLQMEAQQAYSARRALGLDIDG